MPNLSSKPPPMELLINKNEPEVLIKSEPDIENIDFDKSLGAAGENVVIPENPSSNSCIIGEKEEVIKSFIKTEQEDIAMDIVDTKMEKVRILGAWNRCCTVPRKNCISQNKFCYPTFYCNSQPYIMGVICKRVLDVNCTLCQQHGCFLQLS